MDERRGVTVARRQGLEVTGTLGVLLQAARGHLIVLDDVLLRLQATDFRCTPRLLEHVRESALEDTYE
jgi:predicted nucleic acid-binding protein